MKLKIERQSRTNRRDRLYKTKESHQPAYYLTVQVLDSLALLLYKQTFA